jgi:type II secretory pathway component PulK
MFMGEKFKYFPHNKKIATIGELLWIKGFTADILFGQKGNPRLIDLITIYGSGKLNLNTVSTEMLTTILKAEDEYSYKYTLDYLLEERPFQDMAQARGTIGRFMGWEKADRILAKMKLKSEYFRIIATGMVGRVESVVEAVVKRTDNSCDILLWLERGHSLQEQEKEMVL